MKKILIFFSTTLLIFFIGMSNIFAETIDVGDISGKTQVLADIPSASSGAPITLRQNQVNTYGSIYQLWFNVNNTSLLANTLYMFEIYTPQGKLSSNINWVGIQAENEVCDFVALLGLNGDYPKVYFKCRQAHTNGFTVLLNSTSTESITTSNFRWSYTYLRYFTDEENDIDWSAVTSNANQNANNIINNNNTNTQNIINNQNQNTQQQIESQKVCSNYDKSDIIENGYLWTNGSINASSSTTFGITDYIKISDTAELTLLVSNDNDGIATCFYNINKSLISCINTKNYSANSLISIPSDSSYVRFTINKNDNKPTFNICQNGNQALDNSINNLNDSLNNSDIDDSDASSFFGNFNDNTHGLSGIISAPLTAINSMLSGQCSPLTATWKGQDVSFECGYSFWQRLTGFQTFLNVALDGLLCYRILVKLFKLIEKIKNPNDDRVEVMDL